MVDEFVESVQATSADPVFDAMPDVDDIVFDDFDLEQPIALDDTLDEPTEPIITPSSPEASFQEPNFEMDTPAKPSPRFQSSFPLLDTSVLPMSPLVASPSPKSPMKIASPRPVRVALDIDDPDRTEVVIDQNEIAAQLRAIEKQRFDLIDSFEIC